jgi:glutamate racemase
MAPKQTILVFDSGLGGLTVYRAINSGSGSAP